MVSFGDCGIHEREQMVALAIRKGWIHGAKQRADASGIADPVIVLIAIDALDVLNFKFDSSPRNRRFEREQRTAGSKRFAIGVVPYAALLGANAADGWQADMEDLRQKGGTPVVCITRSGQFLVAVDPERESKRAPTWLDRKFTVASEGVEGD